VENGWDTGRLSAGWTVEMCFEDWCAAQMAKKLGKNDDYSEFLRRSTGWKNLFHPPTGLLMPKNADGNFKHTNPLHWGGWIEANAWQASWFTSHDVQGLANLMGSRDEYCRKLNFTFEKEAPRNFVPGPNGYLSYANQTGCQNGHLFNFVGKPWLSQYWVRRVNEQTYGGTTPYVGYGGHDEDQGQMGGVSALMSLGLFSVRGTCAVDPIYEITSPVFDKITIALDNKFYSGKQFVISTENNSAANMYIQSAKLDGQPLNNVWFHHRQLADGGTLELVLGPKPNTNWGVDQLPPSESLPRLPVKVESASGFRSPE
jgi:predicted alpha-1,2-mannosidase